MSLTAPQAILGLTATGIGQLVGTILGGATYAYRFVCLNAAGKLDVTMMPDGIGPDVFTGTAAEGLSANALLNISSTGTIRNADFSNSRPANAYTPAAVSNGASVTGYKYGTITGLSGLTPGGMCYLGASGAITQSPSITPGGGIWQPIGMASSATTVEFDPQTPITL